MNAVISKKETIISYTIAILFILAMVTAGVLLNDPEVILPEIAAMAIALWAYREPGWLRQPEKIFIALVNNSCYWFCSESNGYSLYRKS